MSIKERAVALLNERYSERFAFVVESEKVHLFLIKMALWALVLTFDSEDSNVKLGGAMHIVEEALSGENQEFALKLDAEVQQALTRLNAKIARFSSK